MSSLQRGNAESLMAISFPTRPCLSFFDVFALRVGAIHWWENSCTKRPPLCAAATDATSQYTSAAFDGRILAVSLFVHNADVCRPNGPNQLSLRPWALYTLQVHVLTVCYQNPNFTRSLYVNQRPKSPLSFPFPSSLKVGVWIWNWGVLKCFAGTGRKIAGGWDNSLQVPTCDHSDLLWESLRSTCAGQFVKRQGSRNSYHFVVMTSSLFVGGTQALGEL